MGLSQTLVQSHILISDLEINGNDPLGNWWMASRLIGTVDKDAQILSH